LYQNSDYEQRTHYFQHICNCEQLIIFYNKRILYNLLDVINSVITPTVANLLHV